MSESFDPYHRWLGISPKHQPPDYYRLLAVERFENDEEVIRDAAERQITHVRKYQLGEHAEIARKLLNELGRAKACLLDNEKRAEYDQRLHGERQARSSKAVGAAEASTSQSSPQPFVKDLPTPALRESVEPASSSISQPSVTSASQIPTVQQIPKLQISTPAVSERTGSNRRKEQSRRDWKKPVIIGSPIVGGLLLLVLLVIVFASGKEDDARKEIPALGKDSANKDAVAEPADTLDAESISATMLRTAGWGDANNAPPGLVAILGDNRFQDWRPMFSVAYSPDGQQVATGSDDGTVKIWDAQRGCLLKLLTGHKGNIDALQYDPSGKWLAAACAGGVKLSNIETGEQHKWYPINSPTSISFQQEGDLLGANHGDSVRVWDLKTDEVIQDWPASKDVRSIAFQPNTSVLAVAGTYSENTGYSTLGLWEGRTYEKLTSFKKKLLNCYDVCFSPMGELLAAATYHGTVLSRTNNFKQLGEGRGRSYCVAFSDDGHQLAAGGDDRMLKVWSINPWELQVSLGPHHHPVIDLAFAPNSSDVASLGGSNALRIWNSKSGQERYADKPYRSMIRCLAFSPDGSLLATAGTGDTALVWDIGTRQTVATLQIDQPRISTLAFSPDGRFLAASGRRRPTTIWRTDTWKQLHEVAGYGTVVFNPKSSLLLANNGYPPTFFRIEYRGIQEVPVLRYDGEKPFRAGSTGIGGGRIGSILGPKPRPSPIGEISVADRAISRDGKYVICEANVWDTATGTLAGKLNGDLAGLVALAAGTDFAATGHKDGSIWVWNLESRQLHAKYAGHDGGVNSVDFSPTGSRLVSCGEDGAVRLWNVKTREVREIRLTPFPARICQVKFSPSGRYIATANANGTAYLLKVAKSDQTQ